MSDVNSPDWAPATVTDAVADLRADGYVTDFSVAEGGLLRCGQCQGLHDPAHAQVTHIVRFEGETDPGDEAIVFALTCSECAMRGTLVSAYGASVGADEATVVNALTLRA